jgi:Leucine-rich repeat (LRR) protein
LGMLKQLETMNMFSNHFTGTIPSILGNLTKLESLFLHFNDLTGTMPASLCALRAGVNGTLQQLSADCGPRGKIACPTDCCTACF